MNVGELIEILSKVEDKSQPVYFDDEEWGCTEVVDVAVNDGFYGSHTVVLKGK